MNSSLMVFMIKPFLLAFMTPLMITMTVHTEGVENRYGVTIDANALSYEKKGYHLQYPSNINYNYEIETRSSVLWINLVTGSRTLHNTANALNAITNFVELTPPTNIITNETILTQYNIKQGLQIFGNKGKAAV